MKDCPSGKIKNPNTGRCIDANGKLAISLGLTKSSVCKEDCVAIGKVCNPKTKRCNKIKISGKVVTPKLNMTTVLEKDGAKLNIYDVEGEGLDLLHKAYGAKRLLDYHPPIMMYGKMVSQPRSVGFFSDESAGYKYSKKLQAAKKLTPELAELLKWVNKKLGSKFNGVLVNLYQDGSEYISKHSDDEVGLDPKAGVVAMNLGASRKFRIRDKITNKIVLDYMTKDSEMLQMAGTFQSVFTHEIPKQKSAGERISFTFRYHKE